MKQADSAERKSIQNQLVKLSKELKTGKWGGERVWREGYTRKS